MLPQVSVEGRVVADPELKYTQGGMAMCKMRIVASSRKPDPENEGKWIDDKTLWLQVVCWQKLAENVAESITKGDLVVVTGRLQTDEWETEAGEKRSAVSLNANNIAPSLLFRTVKSVAADRKAPDEDPWATPATSSTPATDEPPF